MNPKLKKFKVLTTWVEDNKVENLLEATLYLNDAFKFIELLLLLDEKSIKYKVYEGFKGQTIYKENCNKFKDIVLEMSDDEIRNVIEFFNNSVRCKEIFKTLVLDDNYIKIMTR